MPDAASDSDHEVSTCNLSLITYHSKLAPTWKRSKDMPMQKGVSLEKSQFLLTIPAGEQAKTTTNDYKGTISKLSKVTRLQVSRPWLPTPSYK